MQRTVSTCPAGATISASVHAPFPEHVSVQSAPSAHVFTLLSHASSPTQSHTLSPSHECALGSSAPAEGDPEGDAVGLADGARVGARVGMASSPTASNSAVFATAAPPPSSSSSPVARAPAVSSSISVRSIVSKVLAVPSPPLSSSTATAASMRITKLATAATSVAIGRSSSSYA